MSTQHDLNLAEWEAIRAQRFPHITDPALVHELHIAYMCGYSAGMVWTKELYANILAKNAPVPLDHYEYEDLENARALGRVMDDQPADGTSAAPQMNPNQIVRPTATQYLNSIARLANMLRIVPAAAWGAAEMGTLHEVDDLLEQLRIYFEDTADHRVNWE